MKKHEQCPVCSGNAFHSLKGYEAHFLQQCKRCSFVFCEPVPENRDLALHYEQYGRQDYKSPITEKRYRELLSRFQSARRTGKILDVGCGVGYFLSEAKKEGWQAHGIEISEKAVGLCRESGIDIIGKTLETTTASPESFDVITAFEFIEHLSFPVEALRAAHRLLRKGGLLYLSTPNFNSLNKRILKSKWDVLSYPEHVSYFTKPSLDRLLSDSGFRKISLRTEGISPGRLKSSMTGTAVDHSSSGTADEQLRRVAEKHLLLKFVKRITNRVLHELSMGENLKALYIKG